MSSFRIALAGIFCVASVLAFAQDAQQGPTTTLHATSRLVLLDVVVTDKAGKPVSNLTQNDFTVLEDKVSQPIASFDRPDQHRYSLSVTDKDGTRRSSNASPSLTILVIDCLNTDFLEIGFARDMVAKYLRTHGPKLAQPTALMIVNDTQLELVHDYSQDAALLEQALKHHEAEYPFRRAANNSGLGDIDRLSDTLLCLEKIAAANMKFAGRKNVIWIGEGFPALNLAQFSLTGPGGPDADLQRRLVEAVSTTANEMWDARLAIYTVDPRGLKVLGPGAMDVPSGTKAFEGIAPQTGGRIVFNRNDIDVAISDSAADGSDYYTLSYYPKNGDWNGRFRTIKVQLTNPNLVARTRSGYYAVPDSPTTDEKIDADLTGALKNPLPYRGLGMSVTYKILSGTPRMARYTVAVDRHDLGWQPAPNDERRCSVMVVAMSVSRKQRIVKNDIKALEGTVKASKFEKQMDKPMLFTFTSELPSDAVRLRVVVRDDRTGNMGTADLGIGEPAGNAAGR